MKKDIIKVMVKQPGRPLQMGAIPNELHAFQEAVVWYEARITKGKLLMLEAKIHQDMLAMIIREVR